MVSAEGDDIQTFPIGSSQFEEPFLVLLRELRDLLRRMRKLRAKGLIEKLPRSRRYRLPREGYCICLIFLKLFERIYAPLVAGLLQPFSGDTKLQQQKRTQLDRLYQKVVDDLDKLMDAVGLKAA